MKLKIIITCIAFVDSSMSSSASPEPFIKCDICNLEQTSSHYCFSVYDSFSSEEEENSSGDEENNNYHIITLTPPLNQSPTRPLIHYGTMSKQPLFEDDLHCCCIFLETIKKFFCCLSTKKETQQLIINP